MGLLDLIENQHNFVERVRRTFNRNSVVVTFTKFAFDRPDEAVSYSEKVKITVKSNTWIVHDEFPIHQ